MRRSIKEIIPTLQASLAIALTKAQQIGDTAVEREAEAGRNYAELLGQALVAKITPGQAGIEITKLQEALKINDAAINKFKNAQTVNDWLAAARLKTSLESEWQRVAQLPAFKQTIDRWTTDGLETNVIEQIIYLDFASFQTNRCGARDQTKIDKFVL